MTTHNATASALLTGTSLSRFTFEQGVFTLNFSRWSREEAFGKPLPFEVALEAQGSTEIHGVRSWDDVRSASVGSDEALLASLLVQLCQSGDDAVVSGAKVAGSSLEVLFAGGTRVVVLARLGAMGPDWVVADSPPGMPPTTSWSVYSEGGTVGSKRP